MARRPLLALSAMCLLAVSLSSAAAQGLFGAPPANAPAGLPGRATAGRRPQMRPAVRWNRQHRRLPGRPASRPHPSSRDRRRRWCGHFTIRSACEIDPAQRSHFVDPAKTVLDKSDALRKSGQGECLDPNMALDNADYDKAEIDKSLKTLEAINGDQAKVIVAFVVAGNPHRLEWKFKKIDGEWKISDLLSVTGEWALSQYQCE